MRPFLGQVPIRASGSPSLGQWYWDEKEEIRYRNAAKAKYTECISLDSDLNAAKEAYDNFEGHDEALYEAYKVAVNRYNMCLDEYNFLWDIAQYGPPPQYTAAWQKFEYNPPEGEEPIPLEPNEPEEPEERPPVASTYEWPKEVPKPEDWPPPEEPPYTTPPDCATQGLTLDPATGKCSPPAGTISEDWRTTGCPPGKQRLVRGGMCVSSDLVSTALTTPTMTTPFTMSGRALLGQVRLVRRPGAC